MTKRVKAFVINPSYDTVDEESSLGGKRARVLLWCRLEDGRSALVRKTFTPYFFIREKDRAKAEKLLKESLQATIEKTDLQSMQREEVVKVSTSIPNDVPKIRDTFEHHDIPCFEADIRFPYRAMMDWGVRGTFVIKGKEQEAGEDLGVDVLFEDPEVEGVDEKDAFTPKPTVMSFDIESDKESGKVYCIGIYGVDAHGKEYHESIINSKEAVKGSRHVHGEGALIEGFVAAVRTHDPDVITGWNVIDFDLAHLQRRSKETKVKLTLGRDGSELKTRLESGFFKDSVATIEGRVVLDGIAILKDAHIKLPDYKLATAAESFTKEKKLIEATGKAKYEEINRLYKEDKEGLLKYNLADARLAYEVIMNSGAFPLTVKRSLLVGMPLDRVSASIASLDSLYLRELRLRGYVAPSVQARGRDDEGIGGFVMQSKPGIYDYVIVCDFKSLYPSLMRTFNIDPLMYVPDDEAKKGKEKEFIEAPNGAHFRREPGIVPTILARFWAEREAARKAKDELARYAIKIHMNSMYGVLASPNCRFFNRAVGNAITSFAQAMIKHTSAEAKKLGYEVIYGDTDSCFIHLNCSDYDEATRLGKEIEHTLNTHLKKFIKEEYGVESVLELEFEKVFIRFIMPKVRGSSDVGAKKRYAGLIRKSDGKEELAFTGLEMVRRDWTDLAKEFQYELYWRVFHKEEVAGFVKEYVKKLRAGKLDSKLVYRKALRKDVEEYTKTTPPHVKAAMLLGTIESDIIEYVMTTSGPEPIQAVKHSIDYEHYVEKQLKPIADSILGFYGTTFDEQAKGTSQSKLFDY